jgi:ABC-type sugar transport system ATPase subunit
VTPLLAAVGLTRAFGHVQALAGVDLTLNSGEVLALVGDNGAGKSTLVKILAGVYRKDDGVIFYEGRPVEIRGPLDAQRLGIATVYQDLALVDVRSVAANIYLNLEPVRGRIFIDFPKLYAQTRAVLAALKIDLPSVQVNVGELSGGQRQAVAIARALARGQHIFLLDEPTAALGVEQQAEVAKLILHLKAEGRAVLVISHNLEHVFGVADRIQVLRQGRCVGIRGRAETTREEVVGLITGAVRGDYE